MPQLFNTICFFIFCYFIAHVLLLLLPIYFQTTYIQLLAARNYVFARHLQAGNAVLAVQQRTLTINSSLP